MSKALTKKRLNELIKKGRHGPGAHIRCRITVDAEDAFSHDRLVELADKLADYLRLEISNMLHYEYMGTGFEVSKRLGMADALEVLGCKIEYYEEGEHE